MLSESMMHFLSTDPPPIACRNEERAEIARQTAEYEAIHGPIQTLPIRPVARLRRLTKAETQEAMRSRSFAAMVKRRQKRWVSHKEIFS